MCIVLNKKEGASCITTHLLFFVSESSAVFPLLGGKGIGLPDLLLQGGPAGWPDGKNHPRSAPVFFPSGPCAKRQSKRQGPIKSGKHIPMGLFILKEKR